MIFHKSLFINFGKKDFIFPKDLSKAFSYDGVQKNLLWSTISLDLKLSFINIKRDICDLLSSKGCCWCKAESVSCLDWKIISVFHTVKVSAPVTAQDTGPTWSLRLEIFLYCTKTRVFLFGKWLQRSNTLIFGCSRTSTKYWWLFPSSSECCQFILVAWTFPKFLGLCVSLNY